MPFEVLTAGSPATVTVRLSTAHFFRIDCTQRMARRGLILAARARRKNDRFTVVVFDARGDVQYQCESSACLEGSGDGGRRRPVARARLFLTPYEVQKTNHPIMHLPALATVDD